MRCDRVSATHTPIDYNTFRITLHHHHHHRRVTRFLIRIPGSRGGGGMIEDSSTCPDAFPRTQLPPSPRNDPDSDKLSFYRQIVTADPSPSIVLLPCLQACETLLPLRSPSIGGQVVLYRPAGFYTCLPLPPIQLPWIIYRRITNVNDIGPN